MFYWSPNKIKELKAKGYKFKYYNYDPRYKDMTIEEVEQLTKDGKKWDEKSESKKIQAPSFFN